MVNSELKVALTDRYTLVKKYLMPEQLFRGLLSLRLALQGFSAGVCLGGVLSYIR